MAKSCHITRIVTLAAALLSCVSCVYDDYDTVGGAAGVNTVAVELSIQTHAETGTSETYVVGSEWENYIDLVGGDYRMYFFTNDKDDANAATNSDKNTLITEFTPNDIYSTDLGTYTTYRASGAVDAAIAEYSSFKLVMLANWGSGNYPSVTPGTTIDDICDAGTFGAFVDESGNALMPSSTLRIPFYGVHEYSGVTWKSGSRTTLNGAITLLRAVAKVEVTVANDEGDGVTFDDVSVVNYNNTGYCAPTNVYLKGDYDHDYTWADDFTDGLHLVNGANDEVGTEPKTVTLYKTTNGDGQETWVGYLTEYANGGTDYSCLSVTVEGEPFTVYFGNYGGDGTCTAYDSGGDPDDRFDIFRNNLYRFYVTYEGGYFRVRVNRWEDVYDNEFTFGSDTGEEG